MLLLGRKNSGKCILSPTWHEFGHESTSLKAKTRRIPVKQGAYRPVLKHGPRSSTCMQV